MSSRRTRAVAAALTVLSCAAVAAVADPRSALAEDERARSGRYRDVQVLAFNDFHGNLQPPSGSGGRVVVGHTVGAGGAVTDATVDAGGAAFLATHLGRLRAGRRATFTVAAGDQVGASPLLSAAFHDEPTMEALRSMGVSAASVGNHEFDKGEKELLRLVRGGCADDSAPGTSSSAAASVESGRAQSCPQGRYPGAGFPVLAANVYHKGTTRPILPGGVVLRAGGIRLGVIGVVLKDTATIVTQEGIRDLTFGDEVEAINRQSVQLRRQGVDAIVALVHQGGPIPKQPWTAPDGKTYPANTTYDASCSPGRTDLLTGSPVLPIAAKADASVDAIVTAHSHQAYVCSVPDPRGRPRLVTQAASFGRLITDLHLTYDTRTRAVARDRSWAAQQVVTRDVPADPGVSALIDRYSQRVAPIAGRVVGRISTDVTAAQNPAGESALGDLISDAQLADPSVATKGAPAVAFMNPGGIRADLTYAPGGTDRPGEVTYQEAFAVQPFGNYLVSMDMTGRHIYDLLGQQFTGPNAAAPKVLAVSKGLTYRWRRGQSGPDIVPGSVAIGGVPVDQAKTYRVVANSFLADGGDGFAAFTQATNKVVGRADLMAFEAYLTAHSPYTPGPLERITLG
ncbi:Endonuclease YhcR [Austwickia sp. TVS 96-490-7B]|nr:Endonuclease YhcR [Austwickia sp. TVS 96-490-7B]